MASQSAAQVSIGEQGHPVSAQVDSRQFVAAIGPDELTAQTYSIELTDVNDWHSKRPSSVPSL